MMIKTKSLRVKSTENIFYMFLLTVFILSLVSCGPSQQVSDLAISKTKEMVKHDSFYSGPISKDFRVKSAKKLVISNADKANGITEEWDIRVTYLSGTEGDWSGYFGSVIVMKKNGKYIAMTNGLGHWTER